jgi:uncharacterized protein YndB with AHSA1/START domain
MTTPKTTHTLGDTRFTLSGDREFVATRVVDAPRSLVWEAWTNPRHVSHWVLGPDGTTMPVCEIDLRPGGKWHFKWRERNGFEMEMRGEYLEVMAPERLVNTESWGLDWSETLNTMVLTEEDGDRGDGSLSVEAGARAGARHGGGGRLVPKLRSARRLPANDGLTHRLVLVRLPLLRSAEVLRYLRPKKEANHGREHHDVQHNLGK